MEEEDALYLVVSGVRRAKAAQLLDKETIKARLNFDDGRVGPTFPVRIAQLYSSREDIPYYSDVMIERWQNVFEAIREGIELEAIDVERISSAIERVSIEDVQFRTDEDE